MGKKKDAYSDSSRTESPAKKRHKVKKHKKHKRKKHEYDDSDAIDVEMDVVDTQEDVVETVIISAAEKLKSQSSLLSVAKSSQISSAVAGPSPPKQPKKKKNKGNKDSGTSSEEERWLDAIESGKLEEVDDELKKIKDPKLMTARQRAMYERGTDKEPMAGSEVLMSLPSGYKEKVMTAEAIQKAQIKSQKRKQLADEKREKDKKKTMERLLKKQDSKVRSLKNRQVKTQVPMISYKNTIMGGSITIPPDYEFPLKHQSAVEPPVPILCAIPGCGNIKKYNCSKTNTPLCSYRCYIRNVETIKQIIC